MSDAPRFFILFCLQSFSITMVLLALGWPGTCWFYENIFVLVNFSCRTWGEKKNKRNPGDFYYFLIFIFNSELSKNDVHDNVGKLCVIDCEQVCIRRLSKFPVRLFTFLLGM